MKLINRTRRGYFFGYGADQEEAMIQAITGRKPKTIGRAVLYDFELRVQDIADVTSEGPDPKQLLLDGWDKSFKSYVIVPKKGANVSGKVFKLSLHERHLVDKWELVQLGWYDRIFVNVTLEDGRKLRAETQVLSPGQKARTVVKSHHYRSWVVSKSLLLMHAARLRKKNGD